MIPRSEVPRRVAYWATAAGSLADALFTLHWVQLGVASEMNPLMDALVGSSPLWFVALKFGGVALMAVPARMTWDRLRVSRVGLTLAAATYSALVLYHLAIAAGIAG